MPQVPGPATDQGIVRRQAAPNARVNTTAPIEAFGGGAQEVQRAIGQAGNQAMQIAREERQKADDIATTEAYMKTIQLRNRLMYDPKEGAMNRKGKDAFGVGQEYGEHFNKGADEIEASLTNDEQRAMYQKIRMRELTDLDGQLTKHTFQQAQEYDKQTTDASIAATREDAVMNYQDSAKVQNALAMQKSLIMASAERNGVAPEVAMLQLKNAESKTHEAVVNRMLANGQDLQASEYYKSIKDSMVAEDAVQLERALEEGTLRGESQRLAQDLTSKHRDLRSALAQVDKIKDPKIQDATRDRVKQRFAEREQAEEYASKQAFHSAFSIAEKAKQAGENIRDSIPPALYNSLTPAQKNSINALANRDSLETDWGEYYNLKTMAASPELRDKFMKTDLMEYRPKLGDSEFKELVNAQNDARKGDTTALDGFRTDQQIVNDALSEAGFDPSPKEGSTDAKKVNRMRQLVDSEVQKKQRELGRKVNNEEMQRIVDDLMVKGVTYRKTIFGIDVWKTEKRLFELEKGKDTEFEISAEDVPAAERFRIENALRSKGYAVTDDNVLSLYKKKLVGGNSVKKNSGNTK